MDLKTFFLQNRGAQTALARELGVSEGDVSAWASGRREIPIPHCPRIEMSKTIGGKVTRRELRPIDWANIWPELVKATKARKVAA